MYKIIEIFNPQPIDELIKRRYFVDPGNYKIFYLEDFNPEMKEDVNIIRI